MLKCVFCKKNDVKYKECYCQECGNKPVWEVDGAIQYVVGWLIAFPIIVYLFISLL